jgi:orotidine-5'-phosphate decarboxylase
LKYIEKLKSIISKNKSHLVIGLDTDPGKIPQFFSSSPNPAAEFNKKIIESTRDLVSGYKLNMAFYEALAERGITALRQSLEFIPPELITICDAKRGDIGNTGELYAKAYLDNLGFDAITISPYMGKDSVLPYLLREEKFVYLLALTSNEGYSDFQKLKCEDEYLFEKVITKSMTWTGENNLGYVFGANHVKEIEKFTSENKNSSVLIPGIGAQDNDLNNLMLSIKNDLFLINSSRSIIYSAPEDCTEEEFRNAVRKKTEEINSGINSFTSGKS